MMDFLTSGGRKYLLLLPIVFLLLSGLCFRYAAKQIQSVMLREKFIEITDAADMLAAAVEANPERAWHDHEANIRDSVEFLDNLYQIYAAAFKRVDGKLVEITARNYETSVFEATDYPQFTEAVSAQDKGALVIGYTPEDQTYRDLYLYFRWMPLYSPPDERYLVVAGVSEHSIITKVPAWVSAGQWASMAVTFALNIWLVILIIRLGYIYGQRKGSDKYRDKIGGDRV